MNNSSMPSRKSFKLFSNREMLLQPTYKFHELESQESSIKPPPFSHMNNEEILQFQDSMMADQDGQLDQLLDVIIRQKNIGSAIGNELDLQVDLLEEAEERIENTNNRMERANNNLLKLFDAGDSKSIFIF
jgi:hypothetical protein